MRDVALFILIFSLLPLCLLRPYVGILLFAFLGYVNPHRFTWGAAFNFPFSQIVALVTLLGATILLFRKQHRPKIIWPAPVILLIMFWLLLFVTSFFAFDQETAWYQFQETSKIFLMTLLTIFLIDDARKMRLLLYTIALSIGFFGFKGGLFAIATGGQYLVFGPQGSFIADNTAIGIALCMTFPLLLNLGRVSSRPIIRYFLLMTAGLTILAIMFTYSRGALLGLVTLSFFYFLRLPLRFKVLVALLLLLSLPVALTLVPTKWVERVNTITTYETDGSAQGRLMAWETAWQVALAHPVTGAGPGVLDDYEMARRYNPAFTKQGLGVHSAYLEILAHNGIPTFVVFMLLMIVTIASLRSVQRNSIAVGGHRDYRLYGEMLQASLYAYAVTAVFLEFALFDLYYHIIAAAIILRRQSDTNIAAAPLDVAQVTRAGQVRRVRNPPLTTPAS